MKISISTQISIIALLILLTGCKSVEKSLAKETAKEFAKESGKAALQGAAGAVAEDAIERYHATPEPAQTISEPTKPTIIYNIYPNATPTPQLSANAPIIEPTPEPQLHLGTPNLNIRPGRDLIITAKNDETKIAYRSNRPFSYRIFSMDENNVEDYIRNSESVKNGEVLNYQNVDLSESTINLSDGKELKCTIWTFLEDSKGSNRRYCIRKCFFGYDGRLYQIQELGNANKKDVPSEINEIAGRISFN
jgi:hypothetical protein